jgi:hypothetical protein
MTVYRGGEIPAEVATAFINAYFSYTPVGTEENNDVPGFQGSGRNPSREHLELS